MVLQGPGVTVFLVCAGIAMICLAVAVAALVISDLIREIRRYK